MCTRASNLRAGGGRGCGSGGGGCCLRGCGGGEWGDSCAVASVHFGVELMPSTRTGKTDGAAGPYTGAGNSVGRREDGTGLVALDPWLEPYSERLRDRFK